jgi:flagellar protein FlaG
MDMAIAATKNTVPAPAVSAPLTAVPAKEAGTRPADEAKRRQEALDSERMRRMIEEIQSHIDSLDVNLSFSSYGKNGENVSITVTEKETGKVIREIPPRELQQLYIKMNEIAGMIFSGQA